MRDPRLHLGGRLDTSSLITRPFRTTDSEAHPRLGYSSNGKGESRVSFTIRLEIVTTRSGQKVGTLKGLALPAVVLGVLAVAADSAAAAKPQTINLLEVDTSFVAPGDLVEGQPPKAGQVFVIEADFYKWNGTRRGVHYGRLQCQRLDD